MNRGNGTKASPLRLAVVGLLMSGVTIFFAGRFVTGVARQAGERAYLNGDFVKAWACYGEASAFAFDEAQIATDRAELLLFGLDQQSIGIKLDLPLDADQILATARGLVASLLSAAPQRAYYWSLASDLYMHEARERRRSTPIDLSTLSDDPFENLLPEEFLAVAAMAEAGRREPRNYFYQDLIAEQLFEWGLTDRAEPLVRRSVALYPVLDGHIYLSRPRLEPEIVEAAVAGFGDALQMGSMISHDGTELDLGRFLARQGRHDEAAVHFRRAMELNPGNYDPPYQLGVSNYFLGDFEASAANLALATEMLPELASAWYYLGLAEARLGRNEKAIEALRRAREEVPKEVDYCRALGDLLESKGDLKGAERQFQAGANLNLDSVTAWLSLLAFYERHPDRHSEAHRVCARLAASRMSEDLYKQRCEALMRRAR